MSIKDDLQATPEGGKPITGHELMALVRFAEHTRHMILFDVLTWDCPVGDKGQRVRIFLTDEGYTKALESEGRGEMKMVRHARVRKGDIYYDAPERDHENYWRIMNSVTGKAESKKTPGLYLLPGARKGAFIMAVFRIEKTQNYTVMSNHHLRNAALTLKAKGLLSQILSLPENWDYTLVGLSRINRESIDAIRSAVQELERAGYITRSRERKENGQLGGADYIIHELPPEGFTPPISGQPTQNKPVLENPTQVISTLENPTQLNKEEALSSKEKIITDSSSTDSIPFTSPRVREDGTERNGTETASMSAFEIYREIIRENIEYDIMTERYPYDKDRIDEIVDLMLETVCTARKTIRVAGDDYPAELVKAISYSFCKLGCCPRVSIYWTWRGERSSISAKFSLDNP